MSGRRGFTLIELLIGLAVASVLAGLALPAFQSLIARQQLRAAVNDLFGAIDLTRSVAMARGSPVSLAPLEPGGAAWEKGWVVFVDRNANSRPDAGDEEIFRQGPVAEGMTIRSRFSSSTMPHYIAYNGSSEPEGHIDIGLLRTCNPHGRNEGEKIRRLALTNNSRPCGREPSTVAMPFGC